MKRSGKKYQVSLRKCMKNSVSLYNKKSVYEMGICLFCGIYKRDLNWIICPFYHVRLVYVHPL